VRARYDDLGDFVKEKSELDDKDDNLVRIREVLKIMDKHFGKEAQSISSRAVAVSAYLYVEGLFMQERANLVPGFVTFYTKLLGEIKSDLKLLSKYKRPTNPTILEEFQKHISQASVEPYAIKSRDRFIEKAFRYYLNAETKGEIIGAK
jgi:hypothetical protein